MEKLDKALLRMRKDSKWSLSRTKRKSQNRHERLAAKLLLAFDRKPELEDGGEGSGNFNHAGRPGQRGGSGGGGSSLGGLKKADASVTAGYTGSSSASMINGMLRKGFALSQISRRDVIERLDRNMQSTTTDMTVFREVSLDAFFDSMLHLPSGLNSVDDVIKESTGKEFTDKGFMSTYYEPTGNKYGQLKMVIHAKPGTKAILTSNDKEKEIILGRDQKWVVESLEHTSSGYVAHITNAEQAGQVHDGGPGSGNFGHKGRPGLRGGSGEGGGSAFRTKSKETKSGYIGVQRAQAFKSIARNARTHKDYRSWVHSLSNEQMDQLRSQYKQTGSQETQQQYMERLHAMLNASPANEGKKRANKPVDGKDISADYSYDGKPYTDEATGAVIETQIEDVIHKQGFDGVPKIVTQDEFDKITKEHPEMPILLRSYSAPNAEVLQSYDDMLESGAWYVDCGTGGAQYGQGMYTAGVYSPEFKDYRDTTIDLTKSPYIKDDDGNTYKVELGSLYYDETEPGDIVYARVGNERKLAEMRDIGNGDMRPFDKETGEQLDNPRIIGLCKPVDASQKDLKGALSEMAHYRSLNESRSQQYARYEEAYLPGQEPTVIKPTDSDQAYEKIGSKSALDLSAIKEGEVYCIAHESKFPGDDTPYMRDMLVTRKDGKVIRLSDPDVEITEEKAEMLLTKRNATMQKTREFEVEKPQSSTRMMTLDPTAKIITYSDLKDEHTQYRNVLVEQAYRKGMEEAINNTDTVQKIIKSVDHFYGTTLSTEEAKTIMWGAMQKNGDSFSSTFVPDKKAVREAKRLMQEHGIREDSLFSSEALKTKAWKNISDTARDMGVFATMLGYDAINAGGHGLSNSYTVVLNRSKVILSEQRVRV